jgi:hypothetical protein
MIALQMVKAKPVYKTANYVPLFNRSRCLDLMYRVMEAKSLKQAGKIILEEADTLEPTKPVPNKRKKNKPLGWKEYFERVGTALIDGRAGMNIFFDKGNTKLPFATFSVLPFVTCPGMGPCQDFCYSVRAWRHSGGFCRQLQNTLLIKFRPSVIEKAFRRIEKDRVLRLYVDGDFDSLTTIAFWMRLLKSRPDIQAYGYSKSWDLLMEYDRTNEWPTNYLLNLSSGGGKQNHTYHDMMQLPIVRNEFVAVEVEYHPGTKGNPGFKRYLDPAYHQLVREKAKQMGYGKVFSCPGKCGECTPQGHACGSERFRNVVIAIGVH